MFAVGDRIGLPNWNAIAAFVGGVSNDQCWQRWKRHVNPKLRRSMLTTPWTKEEDSKLIELVKTYKNQGQRQQTNWGVIERELQRSYLSCRNRYQSITKVSAKRGNFTTAEDEIIHDMLAAGESFDTIGKSIGRLARSVRSRAMRIRGEILDGADLLESLAVGRSALQKEGSKRTSTAVVTAAAPSPPPPPAAAAVPKRKGRKRKRITCSAGE
jgi:hypothetical protein